MNLKFIFIGIFCVILLTSFVYFGHNSSDNCSSLVESCRTKLGQIGTKCVITKASEKGCISSCNSLLDEENRRVCYLGILKLSGRITEEECSKVPLNATMVLNFEGAPKIRDLCYELLAEEGNSELCNKIMDQKFKGECQLYTNYGCDNISDISSKDMCYRRLADTQNDSAMCNKMSKIDQYCIAIADRDPKKCQSLPTDGEKEACIAEIARKVNNYTICYLIPGKSAYSNTDDCINSIAIRDNDPKLCKNITKPEYRNWCLGGTTNNLSYCENLSFNGVLGFKSVCIVDASR